MRVEPGERAATSLLATRDVDASVRANVAVVLGDAITRAQEAWPSASLAPERYGELIAARIDRETEIVDAIAELVLEDIWLVGACIEGDTGALACFDAVTSSAIARALRGTSAAGESVDDLRQRLRVRLFVGEGARAPALASYAGRGSLVAWVRVMATRLRIDAERRTVDAPLPSLGDASPATLAGDPELAYLAAHCRTAFAAAFRSAFDALTPRQRNVLRMHLVAGVTASAIAKVYAVHAASAQRWLADARAELVERVEADLRARLGADTRELESVLRLVRSRLELSVRRLIDESSAAEL